MKAPTATVSAAVTPGGRVGTVRYLMPVFVCLQKESGPPCQTSSGLPAIYPTKSAAAKAGGRRLVREANLSMWLVITQPKVAGADGMGRARRLGGVVGQIGPKAGRR